jgi:hypothetical protein
MIKPSKTVAAMLATAIAFAVSITGANAPSAMADTPSLTYSQFQATQGFIDLSAAAARSTTYLSTLQGLNQTIAISEISTYFSIGINATIAATRNAASAHLSTSGTFGSNLGIDYYFVDGAYLQSIASYNNVDVPVNNATAALARLGKKSATMVKTPSPQLATGAIPIDPSTLFSAASQDPLASLSSSGAVTANMLFGNITSAPAQNDAQSTTYSYSGQATITGLSTPLAFTVQLTFNADGFMTAMTVNESAGDALTLNMTVTETANNALVVNLPVAPVTVTSAQLEAMSTRIDAENAVMPRALAISSKAKALAKKAKVATGPANLIAAAKALKYKYTGVKNGLKVSAKANGSTGSVCVTAVKGKVTVNHC